MIEPRSHPSKLDAVLQQTAQLYNAGQLPEAERLYRRVLRDRPSHADANSALGIVLKDQGKLAEATAAFRRVAAVAPNTPGAHNNLGTILFAQGKLDEAEACYRRALALDPNMADALKNLGLVIVERGGSTESVEWFRRHAELAYGRQGYHAPASAPVPPHKVQHDLEQRTYLGADGREVAPFNLEEGGRLPGPAVNTENAAEIAAQWQSNSPQYVVIDNLLTD